MLSLYIQAWLLPDKLVQNYYLIEAALNLLNVIYCMGNIKVQEECIELMKTYKQIMLKL